MEAARPEPVRGIASQRERTKRRTVQQRRLLASAMPLNFKHQLSHGLR
jgi:hypothetical protein